MSEGVRIELNPMGAQDNLQDAEHPHSLHSHDRLNKSNGYGWKRDSRETKPVSTSSQPLLDDQLLGLKGAPHTNNMERLEAEDRDVETEREKDSDDRFIELTDVPDGADMTDFNYADAADRLGPSLNSRADFDRPVSPVLELGGLQVQITPDVNTYQQKKNLAQGMMDLALLSANANQLRYVLETSTAHRYYLPSVVFIGISIVMQIAVGVGLILNSRYNVKDHHSMCKADKLNNLTVLGVFIVTIVNVFITSFSVATISPQVAARFSVSDDVILDT